ncbi:hypothetical protein MKX03_005748, partial [Papaver bracteatum]
STGDAILLCLFWVCRSYRFTWLLACTHKWWAQSDEILGAYTEMQRKLCSDGKTLKGDSLVVNGLRRSNNVVEYMFHVFT